MSKVWDPQQMTRNVKAYQKRKLPDVDYFDRIALLATMPQGTSMLEEMLRPWGFQVVGFARHHFDIVFWLEDGREVRLSRPEINNMEDIQTLLESKIEVTSEDV